MSEEKQTQDEKLESSGAPETPAKGITPKKKQALLTYMTILFVVVFAKCVGCSLPILAEKIGLDPAVMASPFISTVVDATSLLIYFRFASWLLGI